MGRAPVVRLNRLIDEVRKAVQEVGEDGPLLSNDPEIVLIKDPGIIGFVMSGAEIRGRNVGELTEVAARIGRVAGGPGGIVVHDDNIIVGFMPPAGTFGG